MQSIIWPGALIHIFHITSICPCKNMPATLHIYVTLYFYCNLHRYLLYCTHPSTLERQQHFIYHTIAKYVSATNMSQNFVYTDSDHNVARRRPNSPIIYTEFATWPNQSKRKFNQFYEMTHQNNKSITFFFFNSELQLKLAKWHLRFSAQKHC